MVDKVEISIWYIWMWSKWKAKLWNPWWLLLHSASALINGLNWERQMKFQMKVIESIKFKPPIQMAETQNQTLLRLSVWVSKKALPTSIIHNPIPRSKCHCLFDMYCVFAKHNHKVFPRWNVTSKPWWWHITDILIRRSPQLWIPRNAMYTVISVCRR